MTTGRVVMAAARARPEIGGIESHIAEVAERLVEDGVTLELFASDRSRVLAGEEDLGGVRTRRFPAYPRGRDYYLSPGLFRALLRSRYDLLHVQGIHTLVPPLAMLAALVRRKPYVLTTHTGGTSRPLRARLRGIQFRLLAPLLRRAAAVIAVSEFEARRFERLLGWERGRIRVIRNGGSLPASQVRRAEPVEIASVGRLERYKGHHRAIEALPHLLPAYPGIQLRIFGSGPYERQLRDLAMRLGVAQHVSIEFVPPGDRQAMADRLSAASVITLLSDYEAHPVAVMEALTLDRPVVALRTSGLTEIADLGWVVGLPEGATPAQIADAVSAQIERPIGPDAAQLPTWETCTAELAEVYAQILSPATTP